MRCLHPVHALRGKTLENLQARVYHRIGVVIGPGRAHVGLAPIPVKRLDLIRGRLQHIDGALVEGHGSATEVHLGDHLLTTAADVDNHEIALGHRAQRYRVGGVGIGHPVPDITFTMQHPLIDQILQKLLHRCLAAKLFTGTKRQFEGRASDVIEQHQQLIRIYPCVFGRCIQKKLRVAHDVLVERLAAGHQHPQRAATAPARTPEPLPGRCNAARIAIEDADVQAADVHAQFQRRGGDNAVDTALAQTPFGLTAFARQVTAPIGKDPGWPPPVAVEGVLEILGEHLHHQARTGEHDTLESRTGREPCYAIAL